MKEADVVIAGGGIGGLTLALTLHQIGVSCVVLETVKAMPPLGVGINIQPNAVRELFALGIRVDLLDQVGLPVEKRGERSGGASPRCSLSPLLGGSGGALLDLRVYIVSSVIHQYQQFQHLRGRVDI